MQGFYPTFAKVEDIIILQGEIVIFLLCHCNYDSHYHSYIIELTTHHSFLLSDDVKFPCILHSHKVNNIEYVYLKWYLSV